MQNKIISKTIKIKSPKLPPEADFIEAQISAQGVKPIRWAITEVKDNILVLSVSGYEV